MRELIDGTLIFYSFVEGHKWISGHFLQKFEWSNGILLYGNQRVGLLATGMLMFVLHNCLQQPCKESETGNASYKFDDSTPQKIVTQIACWKLHKKGETADFSCELDDGMLRKIAYYADYMQVTWKNGRQLILRVYWWDHTTGTCLCYTDYITEVCEKEKNADFSCKFDDSSPLCKLPIMLM